MKKAFIKRLLIILSIPWFLACSREDPFVPPDIPPPKVGLISGVGGFDDRGFNQLALAGLKTMAQQHNLTYAYLESFDTGDFAPNIDTLVRGGYNLILMLGYEAEGAIVAAATNNPAVRFVLLDHSGTKLLPNLLYCVFQVDQSAFLCGFTGAFWAQSKDQADPLAAWIGGMDVEVIRQFKTGYESGINYFNSKYHRSVRTAGFFTNSFTDTLQGAKLADSLIGLGAEVIFPFAGKAGNGALYKIMEKGKWGIGVDFDQYLSIPDVGPVLLTSCLKKMNNAIYNIINEVEVTGFTGNRIYYGNLSTVDIDIAPFHDFETLIPDSIKTDLHAIRTGIINGTIATGW